MITSSHLGYPRRGNQWFPRLVPGNITGIDDYPCRGVHYLVAVAAGVIAKVKKIHGRARGSVFR